jgi:tyrosinase
MSSISFTHPIQTTPVSAGMKKEGLLMSEKKSFPVTRREFLATTAVAAAVAAAARPLRGQTSPSGPWTRISLTDPGAPAMLASYATAIQALLKLPATDARNFYRNAFIHTLDCPHGNWWFPPWHRGYLGWWEQTVRQYSGNPNFAFPYWDWTAQPFVPDAFWKGVLNPSDPAYISNFADFQSTFSSAMTAFYSSLTPAQMTQLNNRQPFNTVAGFWSQVPNMFFPSSQARYLTQQNPPPPGPGFDSATQQAVSLQTIQDALATPYYDGGGINPPGGFGSDMAAQHSDMTSEGILESEPHNMVHGNVGGFMGDFLSPVDPIFMAHHSNIDRIWTIWTAQQEAAGQPSLPTGAELAPWQNEPFLFYINAAGQPVTQNTAGAYATIGSFNYTYTQGSGATSSSAHAASATSAPLTTARRMSGTLKGAQMNLSLAAVAQVSVPSATLQNARSGGLRLRAHITVQPPPDTKGIRFHVFVNPPENEAALEVSHPSYAGTFEFFGTMRHAHPVTFTVPLEHSIEHQRNARTLNTERPLNIHVVPQTRGISLRALPNSSVIKIEVSSF